MKTGNHSIWAICLVLLSFILLSFDVPEGWFKAGSMPDSYEMGIDKGAGKDGGNAATIRSIDKRIKGFGTLMQTCLPNKFLGKRVRMSGYMRTKDVEKRAAFWFRVDGKEKNEVLAFDNMYDGGKDRTINGTTDWKKYEIVLDVSDRAEWLAYGALLVGTGQVWVDDITFEIVDSSVATTGNNKPGKQVNQEPVNLDFEK